MTSRRTAAWRTAEYHPAHPLLAGTSVGRFQGQKSCNKVESFGLFANSIRRLKYQALHGGLCLSVGGISSPRRGGTEV
jgi:hypothetical protein